MILFWYDPKDNQRAVHMIGVDKGLSWKWLSAYRRQVPPIYRKRHRSNKQLSNAL